jgi:hypothetical protein
MPGYFRCLAALPLAMLAAPAVAQEPIATFPVSREERKGDILLFSGQIPGKEKGTFYFSAGKFRVGVSGK